MDEIKTVSHPGSDIAFDAAVNHLLADGWDLHALVAPGGSSPLRAVMMRENCDQEVPIGRSTRSLFGE